MRRLLLLFLLVLAWSGSAHAAGLLIPTDKEVPPLALVNHHVDVTIEDQVAVTKVVQVFRNSTDRALEATYIFPIPKGASVKKFTMWVDNKEVNGEMVEADKARTIYTDIVRRMQDPGLLEYMGNNLIRVRVFPVPAHGDQKLALSYTSVAEQDAGLIEYIYPLKTDIKAANTLEKFTVNVSLKSQHPLQNIYSPSHAITISRPNDHEGRISFERNQAALDKDFQLFYTLGDKDVGLTALTYRPLSSADGTFMLLIAPRAELAKKHHISRDMVFVLDTSGSMAGAKMEQARKALKFCLSSLDAEDRFAVMNFATTVNKFSDGLLEASPEQVAHAKKWVDHLQATGGTAIDAALSAALETRSTDSGRPFTMVFFTDGQPTVGETDVEKILKSVVERNTASTRIFTFGVGDDVNAAFLDRLADQTRAVSTYVRPEEDIEVKVSSLYGKISHPVLTNLKLTTGKQVTLSEIYPTQLPDLFHGSQLVVLGRYSGHGHAAVTLTGNVGNESREFVYEARFPDKTDEEKAFVEDIWARRKVGYLLDQIRTNGEKKELVEEVVSLAKKHGITTPYTSYLVVPDSVPTTASRPTGRHLQAAPDPSLLAAEPAVATFGEVSSGAYPPIAAMPQPPMPSSGRINYAPVAVSPQMQWAAPASAPMGGFSGAVPSGQPADAVQYYKSHGYQIYCPFGYVQPALTPGTSADIQTGKLGVDVAIALSELRNQNQVETKLVRQAAGRVCCNVNGAWIDEGCTDKTPTLIIKAQSKAYFRLLERRPEIKEVFQLGNALVWVTPSGTALVIDAGKGKETLTDAEIDALFVKK